jgi:hypothetical protein
MEKSRVSVCPSIYFTYSTNQDALWLTITRSTHNWFGTAINPSWNWLNATEFNRHGCRVTRVLKATKLPINWQNSGLKVRSYDLNQLAVFQQELARRFSATGQTGAIRTLEIHNRIQTGKGIPTRTLCQKNQGTVKTKQKPVTVGDRTLSPERTPLQNGIDEESHLRRGLEKAESATHILCDCEAIASSGTRWLPRRPCK